MLAGAGGPGDAHAAKARPSLDLAALGPALRLAHVLQWQGRFDDAEDLFAAAVASAERLDATAMMAFGYQHLGKSRFDQGRDGEALELFQRALAIREATAAPADQIASSRQAIAATERRIRRSTDAPGHGTFNR